MTKLFFPEEHRGMLRGWIKKLVRLPLACVPKGTVVPVLSGPLRGARWTIGKGTHGYWLGHYEADKQRVFQRVCRPGQCVFDIGANLGYYTLLASRLVGPAGRVMAFEPFPENITQIERHLALNQSHNVTVVPAAVCDNDGTARFQTGAAREMGHLSNEGGLTVRTVSLDAGIARGEWPAPDVMKIDVEGAESSVLAGAAHLLETHHPTIILACHGSGQFRDCSERLVHAGYQLESNQYEPGMYDVLATFPGAPAAV